VTVFVPYEAVEEPLKLRDSYGILLEAEVRAVNRRAP
jgi:hypothetical protein